MIMAKGLTIRQEKFCNYYLECGNASEAYRRAYPSSQKWKDKSVNIAASVLMKTTKVSLRVDELKSKQSKQGEITREYMLDFFTRVLRGERVEDSIERVSYGEGDDKRVVVKAKAVSKSWAAERICKMLGYDAPLEVKASVAKAEMSKEDMVKELDRIRKEREAAE